MLKEKSASVGTITSHDAIRAQRRAGRLYAAVRCAAARRGLETDMPILPIVGCPLSFGATGPEPPPLSRGRLYRSTFQVLFRRGGAPNSTRDSGTEVEPAFSRKFSMLYRIARRVA